LRREPAHALTHNTAMFDDQPMNAGRDYLFRASPEECLNSATNYLSSKGYEVEIRTENQVSTTRHSITSGIACLTRAELTEQAHSSLEAERERLLEDARRERERADQERERAERLQAELDQAQLPWWKRMFGG
jgi:hypothetical protein